MNLENSANAAGSLRHRVFNLIENSDPNNRISHLLNMALIILIIVNVAAVIIESEPSIGKSYAVYFHTFEFISVLIFTTEYLVRLWCCVEMDAYKDCSPFKARMRYAMSPIALIDLLAILPFFISLFITVDLRYLRLLRVLRLMKLGHYFKGFNIFLTVINKELKSIAAAMMVMLFLIIIAASLMYTLESQKQPEVFGSILHSLWWAVVTMTTVGYGDVTPVTTAGKVVATFIMLIGVGLVALPAGMLAARFGEELRERKRSLTLHIEHALADGYIDDEEYKLLEELANKLELSPEELERNITLLKKGVKQGQCPLCGK